MATAYAAVGHGGASGYLAILLLAGYAPESVRPLVLSMNIVVTSYLLLQTQQRDWLAQGTLLLLILASVPAAFLGGSVKLDDAVYRLILGILLFISTLRLLFTNNTQQQENRKPQITILIVVGVLLGFIAGLTGIGGGVLLSPLLLLFRWTSIRQSIPIVAAFILLNSLAGLAGWLYSGNALITVAPWFFFTSLLIALAGAVLGSLWSKKYATLSALRYVLVAVLLLASVKMIGSAL